MVDFRKLQRFIKFRVPLVFLLQRRFLKVVSVKLLALYLIFEVKAHLFRGGFFNRTFL